MSGEKSSMNYCAPCDTFGKKNRRSSLFEDRLGESGSPLHEIENISRGERIFPVDCVFLGVSQTRRPVDLGFALVGNKNVGLRVGATAIAFLPVKKIPLCSPATGHGAAQRLFEKAGHEESYREIHHTRDGLPRMERPLPENGIEHAVGIPGNPYVIFPLHRSVVPSCGSRFKLVAPPMPQKQLCELPEQLGLGPFNTISVQNFLGGLQSPLGTRSQRDGRGVVFEGRNSLHPIY